MLHEIQSSLRGSISHDAHRVGPFLIHIDDHTDNPFRNYAIPDTGAQPTADDVAALIDAFRSRERVPRLEYAGPAPRVDQALIGSGFTVDMRLPLKMVTPEEFRDPPPLVDVVVALVTNDDDLRSAVHVQHTSYGESAEATEHDVDRLRATIDAGGAVALAWRGGAPVGAALSTPPSNALTEIAAVAVLPDHRRRGIATAVGALLTRSALAAGATPYLQAETDLPQLYDRLGYRTIGELTCVSLSTTASSVDRPPPMTLAAERWTLLGFLDYLRTCLVAKLHGLSESDARRPLVASGTNLLGLVKHVAAVESFWVHHVFAGGPVEAILDDELAPDDTVASVRSLAAETAKITDSIIVECTDLDSRAAVAPFPPEPPVSLRWVLVHLVEETARHCGHADILREQLDGSTGR